MKTITKAALAAAFASTALLSVPAFANDGVAVRLNANLDGASVISGGDPDGSGTFVALIDVEQGRLCYDLNMTNIGAATAAHIHEGIAGEPGSPVLYVRVNADRCSNVDGATLQAMLDNPSNYYVDVLTSSYPEGAVRGQLAVDVSSSGSGDGG